eukprot:4028315-Pleurochrysis_carterae.AAC.1
MDGVMRGSSNVLVVTCGTRACSGCATQRRRLTTGALSVFAVRRAARVVRVQMPATLVKCVLCSRADERMRGSSDAACSAARNTLVRASCAARRRRLNNVNKTANDGVSWRHARPAMSIAMPKETLMIKAAAAKAARTQRTEQMYGVQAAATPASSSVALNTAGSKTVTVMSASWSVHEHARNASGASGVAIRSAAATAAGLSAIAVSTSLPMKT